jgi:hypothetical protein
MLNKSLTRRAARAIVVAFSASQKFKPNWPLALMQ